MNGKNNGGTFHSLVPLAEAKAFLGVDDREDSLLGFLRGMRGLAKDVRNGLAWQ
jgi:hypothetical protein